MLDLRGTLIVADLMVITLLKVVVATPGAPAEAEGVAADADAAMLGRSGLEYRLRMWAWMTLLPSDVDRETFRSEGAGGRGMVEIMLLGVKDDADELVRLLLPGTPVPASAVDVVVGLLVLGAMPSEEADWAMALTTSPAMMPLGLRRRSLAEEALVLGLLSGFMFAELLVSSYVCKNSLGRFGEEDGEDALDDASEGAYSKAPDDQAEAEAEEDDVAVVDVLAVSNERFDSVDAVLSAAAVEDDEGTGSRFVFRELAGWISLMRSTTTGGGGEEGGEGDDADACPSLVLLPPDVLPPKEESRPRFFRTDQRGPEAAEFCRFVRVLVLRSSWES